MGRRFWQIRMRCKKNRSSNIMRIGLCVYLFALTVTLIFHDLVADSICSECILSAFSLSFDEWCKIHKFKFLTFGKLFHQNIFLNAFEFFLLLRMYATLTSLWDAQKSLDFCTAKAMSFWQQRADTSCHDVSWTTFHILSNSADGWWWWRRRNGPRLMVSDQVMNGVTLCIWTFEHKPHHY